MAEQVERGSLVLWTGWYPGCETVWRDSMLIVIAPWDNSDWLDVYTAMPSEHGIVRSPTIRNGSIGYGCIEKVATKVVLNRYLWPAWEAWTNKVRHLSNLGVCTEWNS